VWLPHKRNPTPAGLQEAVRQAKVEDDSKMLLETAYNQHEVLCSVGRVGWGGMNLVGAAVGGVELISRCRCNGGWGQGGRV
jgi:hypothetical protein